MMASGFGRALRYALRQAEIYILCIFVGSFALAVWEWLVMDDAMTVTDIMSMIPGMVVWMSMLVILITGTTSGQYWYSMLIAYGCRRKNAFLGSLAMNLMIIAQSLVLFEILVLVFKPEESIFGGKVILAAYLAIEGISQMIGAIAIRWGKIAYMLMVAVVVIACLAFGFVIGYMDTAAFIQQWWVVLVGAVICLIMNIIGWGALRNYEVKA